MRTPFLLSSILVLGCATSPETTAWRMAREADSPAAYRDFTTRYPSSDHAEEARERLAESEQARIRKASTVAACVGVLKTNPDPKTVAMVSDLAFQAAQAETSIESQYLFLAHFAEHRGAAAVRARLEALELERAVQDPAPSRMEFFLYRYPGSANEPRARALLAEKAFLQAKERGSQLAYKAFLARFPESPHAPEVRGWIRSAPTRPDAPNLQATLDQVVGRSRPLQRHACALALSGAIKASTVPPDALRLQLHELEQEAAPTSLPSACAAAGLRARPHREGNLAEALEALAPLEALREELLGRLEVYGQREDLAAAAAASSATLADDLETAELSEEVLGSGPLGNVDAGAEKGSRSAKKASERFQAVQAVIRRERDEVKRMVGEGEMLHEALLAYVIGCVDAR